MRVYDRNLTGAGAAEAGRAGEAQRSDRFTPSTSRASGSGTGDDRVEFSSSLGRLAGVMADFGASRSAKVQALAAQFQAGSYRSDAAATIRAMVGEMLAAGAKK